MRIYYGYKIYPVIKTENQCEDYKVKINGKEVELNTARVSAIPFNRRLPGHQRGLEQTELINFLSCAADEPIDFEITPKNPFEKIDIRPITVQSFSLLTVPRILRLSRLAEIMHYIFLLTLLQITILILRTKMSFISAKASTM